MLGFFETLVIAIIALIVLGPSDLLKLLKFSQKLRQKLRNFSVRLIKKLEKSQRDEEIEKFKNNF